jgi:hypothetical protein
MPLDRRPVNGRLLALAYDLDARANQIEQSAAATASATARNRLFGQAEGLRLAAEMARRAGLPTPS